MRHITTDEVINGTVSSQDYLDCYRLEREMNEALATKIAVSCVVGYGLFVAIGVYVIALIAH